MAADGEDLGVGQVRMLLFAERRRRIEEGCLYPFRHVFSRDEGRRVDVSEERMRRLRSHRLSPIPVSFECNSHEGRS
ncbi:hypothetical protein SM11_chr0948 [Sinorhizobium meliloti SM11]|uniref:Uncharacterized protein n=1 Tax=Sinorhizobium meliloti (strain SM11) TaxID=707241 RepID=F7X2L3_SINMM|nr:hypothetical protein SM11_chr0948 [Sinorhizobium meliloti SM11]